MTTGSASPRRRSLGRKSRPRPSGRCSSTGSASEDTVRTACSAGSSRSNQSTACPAARTCSCTADPRCGSSSISKTRMGSLVVMRVKLQEKAEASLNVNQIAFRPASEKPANDADQRYSSEREDDSYKPVTHSSRIRDQLVGVRLSPVPSSWETTDCEAPIASQCRDGRYRCRRGSRGGSFVAVRFDCRACERPVGGGCRSAAASNHYSLRAEAGEHAIADRGGESRAAGSRRIGDG